MEREVSKGCPHGYCYGPGFLNIQYDSLLNLIFTKRTKDVALVDDVILAIRSETVSEGEFLSNLEWSTITAWSKSNKINFNEEKSRVMLIPRRKRKEVKEIKVYLPNKPL
jgi:sporulation protein YlmC with PRC-barrel domain